MLSIDTPAPPEWASPLVGRPLGPATEDGAACAGYVDRLAASYTGAKAGVGLEGWGWDKAGRRPLARVLVADPLGTVIGAGQAGGAPRPDVVAAQPGIVTTETVGWQATAQIKAGKLKVYGLRDSGEPCLLGSFEVKA